MSENNENGYHFNRIVIVGAGGVGFHLAIALSRDLNNFPMEVWDDDNFVGGAGSRRLPFVHDKTQKKVSFLIGHILTVMANRPPTGVTSKLTVDDVRGQDLRGILVMDCTDMDLAPRKELWKALNEAGATCMRVSYDGLGIVVVSPGLPFVGTKGGGYGLVPTYGQSLAAAGLGAMAVMRALKTGYLTDKQVTISDKED